MPGTLVRTDYYGDVAVERLAIGDKALTLAGTTRYPDCGHRLGQMAACLCISIDLKVVQKGDAFKLKYFTYSKFAKRLT